MTHPALTQELLAELQRGYLTNLPGQFDENALTGLEAQLTIESNGMAALERLLREKFDFLVTTYEVGKLNGIALIAAIKLTRGINRDIKTILLTSRREIDMPPALKPDTVVAKDAAWPQLVRATVERAVAAKAR